MFNVTFIIGNGFDLSLGLKTTYRDFYEHVKDQQSHPDNRIYKAIEESPETWADFELALGRYTTYIEKLPEKDRKQESIKFHDELDEFRDDIAAYLEQQEKSAANMAIDLKFIPDSFFEELQPGQAQRIRGLMSQGKSNFRFVTLNYTNCFEEMLSANRLIISSQSINLEQPLYIHGTRQTDLTLGVSDESQLSQGMTGTEKDDLIKPRLIFSMNDGRIDSLSQTIGSSHVVILFGTSIGETDKYIWEIINSWVKGSRDRYIIIHKHDSTYTDSIRRSSRRQKQFISNVQDKILRYSGLDGDGIEDLKKRIYVIPNTKKLFATNNN